MSTAPTRHSDIVGGSTAKRVMACPASIALCQKVPKPPASAYAIEGSALHEAAATVIQDNIDPVDLIGQTFNGIELTQDLYDEKLEPAIASFDDLLDELETEYGDTATILVESDVEYGDFLPDAFGSCDIIARVGPRVVMVDWKFGNGIAVEAEDNAQLMFYACAAMRTPATKHLFEDAEDIELVIIQPPETKRWVTTFAELSKFEKKLKKSVTDPNPQYKAGDHCKWCNGKPLCPMMNGAVDRALQAQLKDIDVDKLGLACQQAVILEKWIKDLRQLVQTALENGVEVPGWKLVQKWGTRQWSKDPKEVEKAMWALGFGPEKVYKTELLSPAQMEKLVKTLPDDLVTSVSSGTTLAPIDDTRPAVNSHIQLGNALKKLKQ